MDTCENIIGLIAMGGIVISIDTGIIFVSASHGMVLPKNNTYPEIVFFIGLNVDVKTRTSPLHCLTASCSLKPTTDRGGMLQIKQNPPSKMYYE